VHAAAAPAAHPAARAARGGCARVPKSAARASRRAASFAPAAAAAAPADAPPPAASPTEPPNRRSLREPVLLSAEARSRAPVEDAGGAGALHAYMTLPGACVATCSKQHAVSALMQRARLLTRLPVACFFSRATVAQLSNISCWTRTV
jgi:hypothetical protein